MQQLLLLCKAKIETTFRKLAIHRSEKKRRFIFYQFCSYYSSHIEIIQYNHLVIMDYQEMYSSKSSSGIDT